MSKETKKTNDSWLDEHDLTEVIETAKLKILEQYNLIPKDDFITTRKVIIQTLPERKFIEKANRELEVMVISDNGIKYNLWFNSKSLQRSFLKLAIHFSKAESKEQIDLSKPIGKLVGLKRIQFKAQGYDAQALNFYIL